MATDLLFIPQHENILRIAVYISQPLNYCYSFMILKNIWYENGIETKMFQ